MEIKEDELYEFFGLLMCCSFYQNYSMEEEQENISDDRLTELGNVTLNFLHGISEKMLRNGITGELAKEFKKFLDEKKMCLYKKGNLGVHVWLEQIKLEDSK